MQFLLGKLVAAQCQKLDLPAQQTLEPLEQLEVNCSKKIKGPAMSVRYAPRPDITFWVHPKSALCGDYKTMPTGKGAPKVTSVETTADENGKEVTTRYSDGYESVSHYPALAPFDDRLKTHKFCNKIPSQGVDAVPERDRGKLTDYTRIAAEGHHCVLCFKVQLCQGCHEKLLRALQR